MRLLRETFPLAGLAGAAAAFAGIAAFAFGALAPRTGAEAVFAAALSCLVVAGACGPFLFDATNGARRWTPALRGGLRAAALGLAAAATCGTVAVAWDRAIGGALAVGALAGTYAFAAGAVAWALGGGPARVAVAAVALLCLSTLFFWDDAFLLRAEDRKASAARAFRINAAAAASVSLGYDWIHAPEVYRNNQTAESLGFGVRLGGAGPFCARLAPVAAAAVLLGLWRRP